MATSEQRIIAALQSERLKEITQAYPNFPTSQFLLAFFEVDPLTKEAPYQGRVRVSNAPGLWDVA